MRSVVVATLAIVALVIAIAPAHAQDAQGSLNPPSSGDAGAGAETGAAAGTTEIASVSGGVGASASASAGADLGPAPTAGSFTTGCTAVGAIDAGEIPRALSLRGFRYTVQKNNQFITYHYTVLARTVAKVVQCDPAWTLGSAAGTPLWLELASHGSRQAGKGMVAAGSALQPLRRLNPDLSNLDAYFQEVVNQIDDLVRSGAPWESQVATAVRTVASATHAAATASDYVNGLGTLWARVRGVATNGEIVKLINAVGLQLLITAVRGFGAVAADYALQIVASAQSFLNFAIEVNATIYHHPGATIADRVINMLETLERLFGQGNLDIHDDMAGSAQKYLDWRNEVIASGRRPSAQLAAEELHQRICGSHCTAAEVQEVFRAMMQLATAGNTTGYYYRGAPFSTFANDPNRNLAIITTTFVLVEYASTLPAGTLRDNVIKMANLCIFYREQKINVQPAFDLDRKAIKLMTGFFGFRFPPNRLFKFHEYWARAHRGTAITTADWGNFDTRWPAILNLFETVCFPHHADMWQQPHWNPDRGFDDQWNTPDVPQP